MSLSKGRDEAGAVHTVRSRREELTDAARESGAEKAVSISCEASAAVSAEDRHKGITHAAISKVKDRAGRGRAGV